MARLDPFDRPGEAERDAGSEVSQYIDRARRLGLAFVPVVTLGAGGKADVAAIRRGTFAVSREGERLAYLAPDENAMWAVLHWLVSNPSARPRLRVSTPTAIRSALVEAGGQSLVNSAIGRLAKRRPDHSARSVATRKQFAGALLLTALVIFAFFLFPAVTLIVVNLTGAVLFFGVSALRFIAAGLAGQRPPIARAPPARLPRSLPVYSILVPLYREASLVGDLVAALNKLDWPRDRLDIKLVLEAGTPRPSPPRGGP